MSKWILMPDSFKGTMSSWAPRESRQRIMDCTVDNVRAYLQGAPINVVNP